MINQYEQPLAEGIMLFMIAIAQFSLGINPVMFGILLFGSGVMFGIALKEEKQNE